MGFTEAIIAGVLMLMPATAEASTWKERSIECLALNMYHEARDQGTAGKLAVSAVVLNRVK